MGAVAGPPSQPQHCMHGGRWPVHPPTLCAASTSPTTPQTHGTGAKGQRERKTKEKNENEKRIAMICHFVYVFSFHCQIIQIYPISHVLYKPPQFPFQQQMKNGRGAMGWVKQAWGGGKQQKIFFNQNYSPEKWLPKAIKKQKEKLWYKY